MYIRWVPWHQDNHPVSGVWQPRQGDHHHLLSEGGCFQTRRNVHFKVRFVTVLILHTVVPIGTIISIITGMCNGLFWGVFFFFVFLVHQILNSHPNQCWSIFDYKLNRSIFFILNITFKMLTVNGQQHNFWLTNECSRETIRRSWETVVVFQIENVIIII